MEIRTEKEKIIVNEDDYSGVDFGSSEKLKSMRSGGNNQPRVVEGSAFGTVSDDAATADVKNEEVRHF